MASLQAGHSRACAVRKRWTRFNDLEDCDCRPSYYIVERQGPANASIPVGKDRDYAAGALARFEQAFHHERVNASFQRRFGISEPKRLRGPSAIYSDLRKFLDKNQVTRNEHRDVRLELEQGMTHLYEALDCFRRASDLEGTRPYEEIRRDLGL